MMLTPHYPRGVVLSHDGTTIDLRSRLVWCPRWNDLLGWGAYLGADQKLPDFDGLDPGPRGLGALHGRLEIVIDGSWSADSTPFGGSLSARRDNMLGALRDVYALLTVGELLEVTVHEDETYAGMLRVEDPDRPVTIAARCNLIVEISVPAGRLELVE